MSKYLILIFLLMTAILACKKDKAPNIVCTDTVSYATEIAPLINMNCSTSGCHDAITAESGYDLTTHAAVSANADIIISVINQEGGFTPMPLGQSKLADSLINKFTCWANNGALDN